MIRVLVVDDSLTVRQRLIEILSKRPGIQVVGEASDGRRAVELAASLRPHVITLDIVMPGMSGVDVTEQVMAHTPTPILIVSSSFNRGEVFDTYAALAAGALDVLDKTDAADDAWEAQLIAAVELVSKIKVITHPRARLGALGRARPAAGTVAPTEERVRAIELAAIGASTGGPAAIAAVLSAIAQPLPVPMLMILHIQAQFARSFAEWLGTQTGHRVRLAADGERLDRLAGHVLLAPSDQHLITEAGHVRLVEGPPRNHCKPSIDVLFESIARAYGARAVACLLTGMGRDGAQGLLAIRSAGGATISQDEATSTIYGMPREARLLGASERELPLGEIGRVLEAIVVAKRVR